MPTLGDPAAVAETTALWYNSDPDQQDALTNPTGAADSFI